ncbi:MAG: LacI family DNA-binding transcriptional regulator [Pseudomonadota bacterium]
MADRAGVSRSTVSRAFTPGRSISADARTRVLRAARELGYEPDGLAKGLISGRSGIVGILIGELANPIHAVLHQALSFKLQRHGLIPVAAQLGAGVGTAEIVAMFRRYRAEVVVLTSMQVTTALLSACKRGGLRVLLVNRIDAEGAVPSICADLEQGGELAARHLAAGGRRRIAVVEGVAGSWTSKARLAGHLAGLRAAGLAPVSVVAGGYAYADGAAAAEAIAALQCDGVLCPNDLFAIGLMDRLRHGLGCKVPDDVAVVGFDDIPMAQWTAHDLTTVRLPIERMTDRAVNEIVEIGQEGLLDPTRIWVPCRLVERRSA